MRLSILAQRRAEAIQRIQKAVGLDLSETALPKSPDGLHRELHILEAVAAQAEKQAAGQKEMAQATKETAKTGDVEAILERIGDVKGVGPATLEAIRAILTGAE